MSLTDLKVRTAKAKAKPYKLADSGGLYLYVTGTGFKSWRLKFRLGGKERRLTFGAYPEVSLTEARNCRDDARLALREGRDPALSAKRRKLVGSESGGTPTFEAVARRWHKLQTPRWTEVHAVDVLRSLDRDVFPQLGAFPIGDIDVPLVLAILRQVEARGAIETAKRLRQRISGVFGLAISEGLVTSNPASIVAGALQPLRRTGRQPALTDLDALKELLSQVEAADAYPGTKLASRLLALTVVRPGVLRGARWEEFEGIDWQTGDADGALWRVPAQRMKLRLERKDDDTFDHIVPLSDQAIDVLKTARTLSGHRDLVFPSMRHAHQPLSENAIGYLYNRAGYHGRHVPHGWRAAFSTIMNERAERAGRAGDRQIIELVLAHEPINKVESAYNRAAFLDRRRELLTDWGALISKDQKAPIDFIGWRTK